MDVYCAWCLKAGKSERDSFIGTSPGEGPPSHGICADHRKDIENTVARFKTEAERRRKEADHDSAEAEELRRQVDP